VPATLLIILKYIKDLLAYDHLKYEIINITMKQPFSVNRRVAWGDCDAAGITYTPKTLEYAVEAVGDFFREILGISWYDLNIKRGMGQPFVHTEVDFIAPLRADESFTMIVQIEKLGNASITWLVSGNKAADQTCFTARLIACFLDREQHQPIAVPEPWRQYILDYMTAFPVL